MATHFLQREASRLDADIQAVVQDQDGGSASSQDGGWKSRVILKTRVLGLGILAYRTQDVGRMEGPDLRHFSGGLLDQILPLSASVLSLDLLPRTDPKGPDSGAGLPGVQSPRSGCLSLGSCDSPFLSVKWG